jgi:hypothetical protein
MEYLSKAIQGLAAAIVSVAIAASVAYETGYFSIIGYKYQGILSASDYLSSALEWLPWLSLVYVIGLLLARVGSLQLTRMAGRTFKAQPPVRVVLILVLMFTRRACPFFSSVIVYAHSCPAGSRCALVRAIIENGRLDAEVDGNCSLQHCGDAGLILFGNRARTPRHICH